MGRASARLCNNYELFISKMAFYKTFIVNSYKLLVISVVRWPLSTYMRPIRMLCSSKSNSNNSSPSDEQSEQLEHYSGNIPRDKLTITYARSSGPGGQNVNKLNTKVHVRFHLDSAHWIPDRVKERVHKLFSTKITKGGELVITSQLTRSQLMNTEDAIHKLHQMLEEASEVPRGPSELTKSRIKELKRKAERQRLIEKKYLSLKKRSRGSNDL